MKEPVAELAGEGMVMVNSGTAAKPPSSPTTFTTTAVAVSSVRPSVRAAVTVTVCAPSPSDTSVVSNDNRMKDSLSKMVRVAGLTVMPGVRLTPVTVSRLSALAEESSVTARLKEAEAEFWEAGMVMSNGEGTA